MAEDPTIGGSRDGDMFAQVIKLAVAENLCLDHRQH